MFQEGDKGTACVNSQGQQTTCCLWKAEDSFEWLELWAGSGGTGMRQAAPLVILGLLSQGREVDLILICGGKPYKVFFALY